MGRRIVVGLGLAVGVIGGAAAAAALALPWAHYRVTGDVAGTAGINQTPSAWVFQVDGGDWYLVLLVATAALLAGAAGGEPRIRPTSGYLALAVGLAGTAAAHLVTGTVVAANRTIEAVGFATLTVHGSPGTGALVGQVAPVLLGLAGLVLAWRGPLTRRMAPVPA